MGNNKSLEEQHAEIKRPMSEAQLQQLINKSFPVALLGGMLGGILAIGGAFLVVGGLSFGVVVAQIGGWTLILSVFSPIWIRIYAFFRYRKR